MKKFKTPLKLGVDLLISVRFEMRFSEDTMLSNLMPLFALTDGPNPPPPNFSIDRMPASDIPKQIRDSDPSLKYAFLSKISYREYQILTGDKVIAISCRLPYPGWSSFRTEILKFFKFAEAQKALADVDLFLINYVDFIGREYYESFNDAINLSLNIDNSNFSNNEMVLKIIVPDGAYNSTLQILSNAEVSDSNGDNKKSGIVVDISTTCNNLSSIDSYEKFLDKIHETCKNKFFMCLTDSLITKLNPSYE